MISAIAARKAAHAAHRKIHQPSQSSKSSPSSKRKSSQSTDTSSKRRKRTASKQSDNFTLSFDVSKSPDNVIVIDSDDDDGDGNNDSTNLATEVSDFSEESGEDSETVPSPHLTACAWSPNMPLHSASSEDGEADVSYLIDIPPRFRPRKEAKPGTILSTFSPIPEKNIFFLSTIELQKLRLDLREREKGTLVTLGEGDRLCLLGTCRVTVLSGSISVNGIILRPSINPHNIFAPRSSPLPVVEYNASSANTALDGFCPPQFLQSRDSAELVIILLQELRTNVQTLGHVCRTFYEAYELPRSRWEDDFAIAPFRISGLYLVYKQTRGLSPFEMPLSWSSSLARISVPPFPSNPTFLIKGPKKYGKSTFARTLLNKLLMHYKRVAFLECDPGQSEFTPGGFVSLNVVAQPIFGPPYTHPALPFRAHFISSATPKTSPSIYLDGVKDLIDAWRVDVMHVSVFDGVDRDERVSDTIPLVINTMGWSKGLGVDLMQKIEAMVEPGYVFDFRAKDNFPHSNLFELSPQHHHTDTVQICGLESAPFTALSLNYTPADHRSLSILSYFYAIFPSPLKLQRHGPNFDQLTAQSWDTTLPLCAMRPFEVDVHTAFDQIILLGAGSEDVVPDELSKVLNGALVGFVRLDRRLSSDLQADNSGLTALYTQCQPPPSPSESSCIGLGLIRGVSFPPEYTEDPSSRATLHVLTPVPPSMLVGARILVKGEIELPIWGMLDFRHFSNNGDTGIIAGVERGKVPYLQWGRSSKGVVGADKRRVRKNLMRRGQA